MKVEMNYSPEFEIGIKIYLPKKSYWHYWFP